MFLSFRTKVLSPILGIGDPRTDKRIRFVGGSHKLTELAQLADVYPEVWLLPCIPLLWTLALMKIADEGEV